jgi:hypothetical protein
MSSCYSALKATGSFFVEGLINREEFTSIYDSLLEYHSSLYKMILAIRDCKECEPGVCEIRALQEAIDALTLTRDAFARKIQPLLCHKNVLAKWQLLKER